MSDRVEQAWVSPHMEAFKESFLKRNNLRSYSGDAGHILFFGTSGFIDADHTRGGGIETLLEHCQISPDSYKIIFPASPHDLVSFCSFMYPFDIKNLCIVNAKRNFRLQKNHDIYASMGEHPFYIPEHVKVKKVFPKMKCFSNFTPSKLGNKIYHHSGFCEHTPQCAITIQRIKDSVPYELITTTHAKREDYHDESYLKENYYDKCFLNLNLTVGGAITTAAELGLMGRKTIVCNAMRENCFVAWRGGQYEPIYSYEDPMFDDFYNFDIFLKVNSFEDIIKKINNEAKKIGTIQPSISCHKLAEEWLDIDFWKSDYLDV